MLRLHVDADGCVWHGDDTQLATNSYLEVADFLEDEAAETDLHDADCIRLLGSRTNAALIVQLQQRGDKHKYRRIQLCSPVMVSTAAMRSDPEMVMHQLWQPGCSSCLAGTSHDMTSADYCSYFMISDLLSIGKVSETSRRISAYHPAWPALSFLATVNTDAACQLLCEIVDPRWFYHPVKHYRPTKLYAYLGLTPQNIKAYCGEARPDRNYDRALLAIRTWYYQALPCASAPDNSIWRLFAKKGRGAEALLRCTQRVVHLIQLVWLHAVSRTHPEVSFNPTLFFGDTDEAAAFTRHVDKHCVM